MIKEEIKQKILQLLPQTETPFYLFDLLEVEDKYNFIKNSINEAKLYYSLKANSEIEILQKLDKNQANFEIASKEELQKLIRLKITPERIIFGNPVKKNEDLKFAAQYGLKYFVFDTIDEYYKIKKYIKDPQLILRIESVKPSDFTNIEFGATPEDIKIMAEKIDDFQTAVKGLTFYGWIKESLVRCLEIRQKYFPSLRLINLGGGFEPVNKEHDFAYFNNLNDSLKDLRQKYNLQFYIEPGLYIVNTSGYLISRVLSSGIKNEQASVYLDAGKPTGIFHKDYCYEVVVSNNKDLKQYPEVSFYGPTCDNICLFKKKNVVIPVLNDILCFYNLGAYSVCYANNFHSFSKPKIFCIN